MLFMNPPSSVSPRIGGRRRTGVPPNLWGITVEVRDEERFGPEELREDEDEDYYDYIMTKLDMAGGGY